MLMDTADTLSGDSSRNKRLEPSIITSFTLEDSCKVFLCHMSATHILPNFAKYLRDPLITSLLIHIQRTEKFIVTLQLSFSDFHILMSRFCTNHST